MTSLRKIVGRLLNTERPAPKVNRRKHPSWLASDQFARLLANSPTPRAATTPTCRVLMATNATGFNHGSVLDALLAQAMKQRGAEVSFMSCDRALPACQLMRHVEPTDGGYTAPLVPARCESCVRAGGQLMAAAQCEPNYFSEYLTPDTLAEIRRMASTVDLSDIGRYRPDGVSVGEHARAGALRFCAKGSLHDEEHGETLLRYYLESGLRTKEVFTRYLEHHPTDVAVLHHGIYTPQGIALEVCRQKGVRVVTWNPAYRRQCFIFSHDDTYHHTMIQEHPDNWLSRAWDAGQDRDLDAYLRTRRRGTGDWIWFQDAPEEDQDKIRAALSLNPEKPIVVLLSNVVWDAQLHYRSNAFESMTDWVCQTIRYFAARPDLQLVIRVHPAELTGFERSRQPLADEIRKVFPQVPDNVVVIPPEQSVSTYALCDMANAVLIYNTKTGMEVAPLGIPTIVSGEAWIRGKGFTYDATSPESYRSILAQLPFDGHLNQEQTLLARRYAYHVLFRRMIPVRAIEASEQLEFLLTIDSLADLLPGRDPGLDVIVDGIMTGSPFIYEPL